MFQIVFHPSYLYVVLEAFKLLQVDYLIWFLQTNPPKSMTHTLNLGVGKEQSWYSFFNQPVKSYMILQEHYLVSETFL